MNLNNFNYGHPPTAIEMHPWIIINTDIHPWIEFCIQNGNVDPTEWIRLKQMRVLGLEPKTYGLKGRCSTKLSYTPFRSLYNRHF